jgi:pilus assembly protein CpaC
MPSNKNSKNFRINVSIMALVVTGLLVTFASYAQPAVKSKWEQQNKFNKRVEVALNKSTVLQLNTPVKKISIGNPAIADILVLRAGQVYVLGKGLGSTNVLLWDKNDGVISNLDVEVTHDLDGLKAKLYELMPDEEVNVYTSQNSIILSGLVSSVTKMDAIIRIAESFTGEKRSKKEKKGGASTGGVINLMQVGGAQQVMLEVKVAELSRSIMDQFGIKFDAIGINSDGTGMGGLIGRGATFPPALNAEGLKTPIFGNLDGSSPAIGPAVTEVLSDTASISRGIFGSLLDGDMLYNIVINAAKDEGVAKVLAEPTLTTLSGQQAVFLSGGEFPIPVPGENNEVTVEFKDFGIGLDFLPVVLDARQINLSINVAVSELQTQANIQVSTGTNADFFIPALTKRSASSTVELADGQTIAIAGLINENMREVVSKIPGLGDIPVLGALFRSKEFIKGQTELVILVTPHLAKPVNKRDIRLPTDNIVDPSALSFYLMGDLGVDADVPAKRTASIETGSDSGKYGHQVNSSESRSYTEEKLNPPSSQETEFYEQINELESSYD